ncbi:MAG: tetratricopeptide repeat protein [Chloroflexota bacterium]|nr:tetratricopeptide repeat protein [Chloroflexota bacterium]
MSIYERADALIRAPDPDQVRQGLELLRAHAESHDNDAVAWFQYGGGLDSSGDEAAAIIAYDRVFELGLDRLDDADRPRIYVQAGSTLRNLGRLDEARALLEQGCEQFPAVRVLRVFLALVEVSAGRDRRAIDLLFEVVLGEGAGDDSVSWYPRSLVNYAAEIRQS